MDLATQFAAPAFPRIASTSLAQTVAAPTARIDAKQSQERFAAYNTWIASRAHFRLGDVLPTVIAKGDQPVYSDGASEGIPVISTLAIQNLTIVEAACRFADSVDHGQGDFRRPKANDVLLTVDGGSSIGKPVLFDLDGEWGIDSHVAILRPEGLDPEILVYLLASPLGQLQFNRAESGASGQTSVTESDMRLFTFPLLSPDETKAAVASIRTTRNKANALRAEAAALELSLWNDLV